MIDFTDLPIRNKTYAGANGSKISVLYNDELYMLKFPAVPSINKQISCANGCISEYLGCHIFESIGIPVQKTLLGTYTKNGKQKIVVACKDFTSVGLVLQDFFCLSKGSSERVYPAGCNAVLDYCCPAFWPFLFLRPSFTVFPQIFFWPGGLKSPVFPFGTETAVTPEAGILQNADWLHDFTLSVTHTCFFAASIHAENGAAGSSAAEITKSALSDLNLWR